MFKVGDKVLIINNSRGYKYGEVLTVVGVEELGRYPVTNGFHWCYVNKEDIKLYEGEKKGMRYSIGDKVVIVDNLHDHGFDIGDFVTITKVDEDYTYRAESAEDWWWVWDDEIELASSFIKFPEHEEDSYNTKVESIEGVELIKQECRSPYCECEKDNCNNGWVDKRGIPFDPKVDVVNKPQHYMLFPEQDIEVKDVVKLWLDRWERDAKTEISFYQAACLKEMLCYILRSPIKNEIEDLQKARWYLDEIINELEGK